MNDFTLRRQSQFTPTCDEIINQITFRATGQYMKDKQRIIEGNDSEVYDITMQNDEHSILKIHRFGSLLFTQEAWAINECRKHDVPVPQVLYVGKESINNKLLDIIVLEKVKGTSFKQVIEEKKLSKNDIDRVLKQAGAILKKIHSIKVNGYWQLNHDNQWSLDSWTDYVESSINDRTVDKQYLLNAGFSEEDFDFIIKCHHLFMNNYECHQPVLCHGDYTYEHWFVDDNLTITGVIDFGDMQGGPLTTDFAIFKVFEPETDITPLIQGYFGITDSSIDMNFSRQLDLHTLVTVTGHAIYFMKQNDPEEIRQNLDTLKKSIEHLKNEF